MTHCSYGTSLTMFVDKKANQEAADRKAQHEEVDTIYADLNTSKRGLTEAIRDFQTIIEKIQNEENIGNYQNHSLAENVQISEYLDSLKEAIPLLHAQTLIYEDWENKLRANWKMMKKEDLPERRVFLEQSTQDLRKINERLGERMDEIMDNTYVQGVDEDEVEE